MAGGRHGSLRRAPAWPRSSSAGSTPRSTGGSRRSRPTPATRRRWQLLAAGHGGRGPGPPGLPHVQRALHRATMGGLAAKGARVQRPLWASTSTKNPAYPDLIYVDTLIGPDTVNTMPDRPSTTSWTTGRWPGPWTPTRTRPTRPWPNWPMLGIDMADVARDLGGRRGGAVSPSRSTSCMQSLDRQGQRPVELLMTRTPSAHDTDDHTRLWTWPLPARPVSHRRHRPAAGASTTGRRPMPSPAPPAGPGHLRRLGGPGRPQDHPGHRSLLADTGHARRRLHASSAWPAPSGRRGVPQARARVHAHGGDMEGVRRNVPVHQPATTATPTPSTQLKASSTRRGRGARDRRQPASSTWPPSPTSSARWPRRSGQARVQRPGR